MWSRRQTARLGIRAAVVAVRVLGGGAVDEHAIADGDRLDVRADRFDFAAGVGSGNEGQRGLARVRAAADVDVDGIHADGAQPHDHLIGRRHRIGDDLRASAPRGRHALERQSLSWRDAIMRTSSANMNQIRLHKTVGVKVGAATTASRSAAARRSSSSR